MADCCCGNPEGTNKECERCRLVSKINDLTGDLFSVNQELIAYRRFYRSRSQLCVDCGHQLNDEDDFGFIACGGCREQVTQ